MIRRFLDWLADKAIRIDDAIVSLDETAPTSKKPPQQNRLHRWIERATRTAFGVSRLTDRDYRVGFRIGTGDGARGLCHVEAFAFGRMFYLMLNVDWGVMDQC